MNRCTLLASATALLLCACESGSDPEPLNQPPVIGAISAKQSPANETVSAIDISLADEAPEQVTVTVQVADATLIPDSGIVLDGSGVRRTLTLQPAADRIGTTQVTVRATDAQGRTGERQFELAIIRQQRSIQRFARAAFARPADGTPLTINAIEFVEDAEHDDFADLFE